MFTKVKRILGLRSAWGKLFKPEDYMDKVEVPVKSAAKSKINWGAGALLLIGIAQLGGVDISDEAKTQFGDTVGAIAQMVEAVVLPTLLIIWRTWFNNTATPGAVKE